MCPVDNNKKQRLVELGYRIRPCCALCCNSQINPASDWGTCMVHSYEHGKHGRRPLSIHRLGYCGRYTPDVAALKALHGFADCCTSDVLGE